MRTLFWLGVLGVGALFVAGAIHIQRGPDNNIEITVDKAKAERTAERALEEGREFLQRAEDAAQQAEQSAASAAQQQQQQSGYRYNR